MCLSSETPLTCVGTPENALSLCCVLHMAVTGKTVEEDKLWCLLLPSGIAAFIILVTLLLLCVSLSLCCVLHMAVTGKTVEKDKLWCLLLPSGIDTFIILITLLLLCVSLSLCFHATSHQVISYQKVDTRS